MEVLVDTQRFAYCFNNLVDNARLYGGGVPEFERTLILEPFSRGSQHSKIAGSGLGLAIVTEHMRSMGGYLVVGESPQGGARFSVALRRNKIKQ